MEIAVGERILRRDATRPGAAAAARRSSSLNGTDAESGEKMSDEKIHLPFQPGPVEPGRRRGRRDGGEPAQDFPALAQQPQALAGAAGMPGPLQEQVAGVLLDHHLVVENLVDARHAQPVIPVDLLQRRRNRSTSAGDGSG